MSFFSSAKNFSRFCNSLRYNYSSLSLTRPTISLPDAHPFSAAHFRGYAAKPATAAKKPWMKRDETVRTEPTVETTVEEVLDEESAISGIPKITIGRLLKQPVSPPNPNQVKKPSIPTKPTAESWQLQKNALTKKFGKEGWNPRKKLSPDAMEGIRALNAQYPEQFTTPVLAAKFEVSPEAIRRILKSKWRPTEEQAKKRSMRWERRADTIWSSQAELGLKPHRPARAGKVRQKGRGRRQMEADRPLPLDEFGEEITKPVERREHKDDFNFEPEFEVKFR